MVINRAIRVATGHSKKGYYQLPRFTGNPIGWVIADAPRRKSQKTTKKQKNTFKHVPLKRREYTTDIGDVSTAAGATIINEISQGTSTDGERTERRITCRNVSYKSTILWEGGGGATADTTIRFLVYTCTPEFNTSTVAIGSNVYDKRDFGDIGHVYKDFRVVRKTTTTQATPIHFFINLRNLHLQYDGDAGTDNLAGRYSRLVFQAIGDQAATTKTATNQTRMIFRYHG